MRTALLSGSFSFRGLCTAMPCRLRREPLRAGAAFMRVNSLTSLLRKRCLLRPPSSPPIDNYTNPILSGSFSFCSKTHTHKREMSRRVNTFYLIYTRLKYKSNIRSYYGFILSYLFFDLPSFKCP